MTNDKIDNEIFVTILHIREINNRAHLDSIYKEIEKSPLKTFSMIESIR